MGGGMAGIALAKHININDIGFDRWAWHRHEYI